MPAAKTLRLLNRIARIASEDLELQPMLQRVTDVLTAGFGWQLAALVRVDREHGRLVCAALSSCSSPQIFVGFSCALGTGVIGEVARSGKALVFDDVQRSAHYREVLPGVRSQAAVPVRHRGKVVAVLSVESHEAAAFRGQLALLETVAEQIAGAIASSELFGELHRRARDLELLSEVSRLAAEAGQLDDQLEQISHYARNRLGFAFVSISLLDEDGRSAVVKTFACDGEPPLAPDTLWPLDRGLVGKALRTGERQVVLDVHRHPDFVRLHPLVTSEAVFPIRCKGELLGIFNVEATSPEDFPPESLELLATLADQIAGAIRLAMAKRRLEESNRQLREANVRLERLSMIDPLTGVWNRRHFDQTLDLEWRRARREQRPLSALMIDIDCFKLFNDAYGHLAGDTSLRQVADVLQGNLKRAGDVVARYGGEEFAVILPGLERDAAYQVGERLRREVERLGIRHKLSSAAEVLTISAGVAIVEPSRHEAEPGLLVAEADHALYLAKSAGRNRVILAPD